MTVGASDHDLSAGRKAAELSARGWLPEGESNPPFATDVARVLPWCAEAARRAAGVAVAAVILYRPVWDDLEVVVCAAEAAPRRLALIGVTDPRTTWEEAHAHAASRRFTDTLGPAQLEPLAFGRAVLEFEPDAEVVVFPLGTRQEGGGLGFLAVVPIPGVGLDAAATEALGEIAECVRVLVSVVRTAGTEQHRATMLEELLLTEIRLSEELPVETMLELWCNTIVRVTSFQNVFVGLYHADPAQAGFRACHATGWRPVDDAGYTVLTRAQLGRLLDRRFMVEGCAVVPFDAVQELIPGAAEEALLNASGPVAWDNHWLLVPLYGATGELMGVARLDDPVDLLVPSPERLRAIQLFSNHLTQAIALRGVRRQLSHLAATDMLTRLPNRRAFETRLAEALAHARRHGGVCALIAVDFDSLKAINDSRGHAAGDAALVDLAQTLRQIVRAEDSAYRIGGDEFALLLPDATAEEAEDVVARIRAALAAAKCQVSASFGVAIGPTDADDVEGLMQAADVAMYRDKGRRE
jgi:diguanylate cyclase (GGDEF)-like protein